MPSPQDFGLNESLVLEEVIETVEGYEEENSTRLDSKNRYWDLYKGERKKTRPLYGEIPFEGVSNSFVHETPRATDSLATTRYRLIMSHDPPFEIISSKGDIPEEALYKQMGLYSKQMEWAQYKRFLRKSLTSLDLIGNACIFMGWGQTPSGIATPFREFTTFEPKPLDQIFFSAHSMSYDSADKKGTLDIVTKTKLMRLMAEDPNQEVWMHDNIKACLSEQEDDDYLNPSIKRRLTNAGYKDFTGLKELILYYGPLEKQGVYDNMLVGVLNRKKVIRIHPQILPWSPFLWAFTNEIEQEAWALGVGPKGEKLQYMMNANRDRIFNVILFAIFSMMKMSRYAGIRQSDLRIKPFNIIPMDDIKGLEQLTVDVNAANYGIKMEEMLVNEFQSLTGAYKNLQAVPTDVTATEATLVDQSGMRKIAVDTEIIAEELLRNFLYYSHKQNQLFLDKPIWMNVVGPDGANVPIRMFPDEIAAELDFNIKISTDKDFRPQITRRIIEFLQVFTSIRQFLPPDMMPNLKPYIDTFTRMAGIDPRRVWGGAPTMQYPEAMQSLATFTSGQARPSEGAMREATMRGLDKNPNRFPAEREAVTETNQGGMTRNAGAFA